MNKNTHTKIYIHLKHVQIIQTILSTTKQNKNTNTSNKNATKHNNNMCKQQQQSK